MTIKPTAITSYSPGAQKWNLEVKVPYQTASDIAVPYARGQKVPMWLFVANGKRVMSRRPVEIEILEEDGCVLAVCERLHVFASGDTYEEAIESLSEQVVHFCCEYLALGPQDVIGKAVEIRELYNQFFEVQA